MRDLLYYRDRLVVPKTCHQEVLVRVHSGAHFGQARTLRLSRRSYFWFSMARGARAHCRACIVCQRKPSRAPKQLMELFGTVEAGTGLLLPWKSAPLHGATGITDNSCSSLIYSFITSRQCRLRTKKQTPF